MFKRQFPQLGQVDLARTWAGVIDATPDLVPVLGEVAALRGFFFVCLYNLVRLSEKPLAKSLVKPGAPC